MGEHIMRRDHQDIDIGHVAKSAMIQDRGYILGIVEGGVNGHRKLLNILIKIYTLGQTISCKTE